MTGQTTGDEAALVAAYLASRHNLPDLSHRLRRTGAATSQSSLPVRLGQFRYSRQTAHGQYAKHLRWTNDGTCEVVLDENEIAGEGYFELGCFLVSPDGRLLAYTADRTGDECYQLHVRDIATGADRVTSRAGVGRAVAWVPGSNGLCYLRLDRHGRAASVWRMDLDSFDRDDRLILAEPDEGSELDVGLSKSGKWLFLTSVSAHGSTVSYALAADSAPHPRPLLPGDYLSESCYAVHADGPDIFALTERDGLSRVLAIRPGAHGSPRIVMEPASGTRIDEVDATGQYLVLRTTERGLRKFLTLNVNTNQIKEYSPPSPDAELLLGANPDPHAESYRYCYTSLTAPRTFVEHRLRDGLSRVVHSDAPKGYKPSDYTERRLYALSADGTQVPMTVMHRRDLPADGRAAGLLVAYGSYGQDISVEFLPFRQVLADLGFVFAIGYVRGGGALGPAWHAGGRAGNKPNSIADLIACASHLIESGIVAPDRLTGRGFSAAGVLFGAAMNQRPGLFSGVALHSPLVDVAAGVTSDDGSLIPPECEEWGDPSQPGGAELIRSYSPIANVQIQAYPGIWVTASTDDPRVRWQDVARWVTRVRSASTSGRPVLLRLTGGGHNGPSGRDAAGQELAQTLSFLCDMAGIA